MDLQIIKYHNQRVLTSSQLAESYGADGRRVSENFNRNKNRFIEGKHYFALEGEQKRLFLDHTQIEDGLRNAAVIYLWTEKGSWLHAKSLNTDQAWEAYEMLVDEYYRVKDVATSQLSPELQMFKSLYDAMAKQEIALVETQQVATKALATVTNIKDAIVKEYDNWRDDINKEINRIQRKSGTSFSELKNQTYESLEQRARCDLSTRLRNLRDRLANEGATKTKINNMTKLDVIETDPRLKAIYTQIVKELAVKYTA